MNTPAGPGATTELDTHAQVAEVARARHPGQWMEQDLDDVGCVFGINWTSFETLEAQIAKGHVKIMNEDLVKERVVPQTTNKRTCHLCVARYEFVGGCAITAVLTSLSDETT